ncbi:MAG: Uma2 family endonuclease [Saprospiraceae bacterium]|nr:Uma2 family endonuclease [Saprospiraceae bacterium]
MSAIDTAPSTFTGIALRMPNGGMTDEQFYQFCMLNPDLRIERTPDKIIEIMPPTNSETGKQNFTLSGEIYIWHKKNKLGEGFDSSTGFKLPNGAERSPDAAWISSERWNAIPKDKRQRFAPIAPDFVAEIRSSDQSLNHSKDKMEEYIECGCQLAWLIDPKSRKTWVYQSNGDIHTIPFEEPLSGGDVMPGFEVRMADIFE